MRLSVTNIKNLQGIASNVKWSTKSCISSIIGERKLHTSNSLTSKTRYSKPKLTYSYVHGLSDIPLSHQTVGSSLVETVEKFPDHECLVFCEDGIRRTFSQFMEEVDKFAAGLIKLGIKKGDRVGIWGPSSLEWVLTQFATGRIGAVLVNVNPAYQVNELAYVLRMVGCKAIVASAGYKTQDYYGMLHTVAPEIENSDPGRIKNKKLPELTTVIMMGDKKYPGAFSFPDVLEMGCRKEIDEVNDICQSLQSDDIINVQFTSGTTGHPKGATLTHHNIVNNAIHIGSRMGTDTDFDRILCQVPLYHCFGMVGGVMVMSTLGATNIFPVPGYDPVASLEALVQEKCTSIYGTPTMYIDVCSHAERQAEKKITHLTKGIMAGSPCPPEVIKRAYDLLGAKVQVAYGSTETSPVVCMAYMDDDITKRTTTVGHVLGHVENKIVDQDGAIVPINQPGEHLSRGYVVMQKYWGDKNKTDEAIDDSGWYHTGDIATMDEDGYSKIVGRIKDLIIRGGENIYPTEVEDFLHTHPKIDDVQVIGLPDKRFGEEVGAWIRLKEGQTATEQEIKDYCKGKITHFKIPKYIKFVDDFPITVTRKVQKYVMRDVYSKELGLAE